MIYGGYYGVVNNVGIICDGVFFVLIEEDWDGVIYINLDSFYNVLYFCVMFMIGLCKGG